MGDINRKAIIVPHDFTDEAECALDHAIRVAESGVNSIHLIHVINSETKSKLKKKGRDESYLEEQLKSRCAKIEGEGIEANFSLREGSIFSVIGDVAEEIGAGLMMLGTHGVHGVQHLIGAYALKVVADSPVPVIVVQNKAIEEHGYKSIILPIDSYIEEKQKVFHVISIAKVFNSTVKLFISNESDEFLRNNVVGNANFIQEQLQEAEIDYTLEEEDPKSSGFARQLVRYAAEQKADLICIMSEKGKDLKEFIVGPNSERIINNDAQIPVLCVNPMDSHIYTQSIFTY